MLHLSPACRYFYYNGDADKRKGAYSLSRLLLRSMQRFCKWVTKRKQSFY